MWARKVRYCGSSEASAVEWNQGERQGSDPSAARPGYGTTAAILTREPPHNKPKVCVKQKTAMVVQTSRNRTTTRMLDAGIRRNNKNHQSHAPSRPPPAQTPQPTSPCPFLALVSGLLAETGTQHTFHELQSWSHGIDHSMPITLSFFYDARAATTTWLELLCSNTYQCHRLLIAESGYFDASLQEPSL